MKKFLSILLFALLAAAVFSSCSKEDDLASSTNAQYLDYSPQLISKTKGDKILFFSAPWCIQCHLLDSDIKDSKIPKGVTIFKVDYDSNQDLREKYGVTIQTTLVKINDKGEKVSSFVARNPPTLQAVKNALLK